MIHKAASYLRCHGPASSFQAGGQYLPRPVMGLVTADMVFWALELNDELKCRSDDNKQ